MRLSNFRGKRGDRSYSYQPKSSSTSRSHLLERSLSRRRARVGGSCLFLKDACSSDGTQRLAVSTEVTSHPLPCCALLLPLCSCAVFDCVWCSQTAKRNKNIFFSAFFHIVSASTRIFTSHGLFIQVCIFFFTSFVSRFFKLFASHILFWI